MRLKVDIVFPDGLIPRTLAEMLFVVSQCPAMQAVTRLAYEDVMT